MVRRSRLRPVGDVSSAEWVVQGVGAFGSGVGGLVPHGFEAYARILHPASAPDGRPVTWAEVAAWSGRVIHPRVQFRGLAIPARPSRPTPPPAGHAASAPAEAETHAAGSSTASAPDGRAERPWDEDPEPGTLTPGTLAALCEVLARHTTSGDRCWFCTWDGYGSTSTATFTFTAEGDASPEPDLLPPEFPPGIENGPRVELPERSYLLLEGPLDAAGELAMSLFPQSPNLFWPDDRAWCVATEIDLDSTYLGGTAALVAEVLADERLEAVPVEVTDPVWADSDEINR